MNTPYIKQFDQNGKLINPIKGAYINEFNNRKERRAVLNQTPFHGNGNNFHLTVIKGTKFKRVKQLEFDQKGNMKVIFHYLSNY